jgi:alpha-galactosidase
MTFVSLTWSVLLLGQVQAGMADDLPQAEAADPVMASAPEVDTLAAWAATAFAGAPEAHGPVRLRVERQDHNVLRFGRSCMETPLRIGSKPFEHGLGTHARSEIVVEVPPRARSFEAMVGVDHNDDTAGVRGSVAFVVCDGGDGGQELFHSRVLTGRDEAAPVRIALTDGMRSLRLIVDTTPDGPSCDQADWADARFVLDDGSSLWLDTDQPEPFVLSTEPPFSFTLGGDPSRVVLARSERTVQRVERDDRVEHHVAWLDPQTGLRITAVAGVFRRYPAVDWLVTFQNTADHDTPVLESIQSADVLLRTGNAKLTPVVHQLHGDACGEASFVPFDTPVDVAQPCRMAPTGGRSSSISAFPFFNVEYQNEGLITAVGWSGQWAALLDRTPQGPTRLAVGLERTHLVLHPGETIRGPRVLAMSWKGDRIAAHNRFRRLMLFHYVPQHDGRPVALPIASQCFDRYVNTRPEWATESGQIHAAEFAHAMGFDTHWLDAAWFPGGFPNGVGTWTARPDAFPRGLKPVADACHSSGLKFVLWFEPERVAPGSDIAREHPEFVHGGSAGGLFRLDDPAARQWLGDLLSARIAEYGVDVYRNDFNMDPLDAWRANDPPDRQGMTEIRYVTGLYELWDRLRAEHPGLLIDNCASGGRRIDLETCMRSVPLWRSDTGCSPGHPQWNQTQTLGLGPYVPLHTSCGWSPSAYEFRSSATGGAIAQWDFLNPDFPQDEARAALIEARANRPFFYGDFYPLTPFGTTDDQIVAYQFHRPDRDAGLVLAFRRHDSRLKGVVVGLSALDPDATYVVETIDDARRSSERQTSGRELMENLTLRPPDGPSSVLVRYHRADR